MFCNCKKGFPKNFEKFSGKHLCWRQKILMQTFSCEFYRIFKNIYFVEHLWTHACVNWSNKKYFRINIFTEKYPWKCHLKYSCWYKGLEFYLKGTQSNILFCKFSEVSRSYSSWHCLLLGNCSWFPATFLTYRWHYQQYTHFSHNYMSRNSRNGYMQEIHNISSENV